jgi:hypothetical protein
VTGLQPARCSQGTTAWRRVATGEEINQRRIGAPGTGVAVERRKPARPRLSPLGHGGGGPRSMPEKVWLMKIGYVPRAGCRQGPQRYLLAGMRE